MIRIFIIISFIALILGIGSCDSNNGPMTRKRPETEIPTVAATIWPVTSLVKDIVGDKVKVMCILPPDQSPHTFDPKPEVLRAAANSMIFFKVGRGLDDWLDKVPEQSVYKDYIVVTLADGCPSIESPFHHHDEKGGDQKAGKHHHHGPDPHVWMDPTIVVKYWIPKIKQTLGDKFPQFKKDFELAAEKLVKEISDVDKEIEEKLSSLKNRKIITHHGAFFYFCKRYNLETIAVIEDSPGREVTARQLKEISEKLKQVPSRVIFIEPQLDRTRPEIIAKDNDAKLQEVDVNGNPNSEWKNRYPALLKFNMEAFYQGLQ